MLLKLWRLMTLVLAALTLGLSFAHALERPAKMGYDPALYITLQRTLYSEWRPPHIGGDVEPAAIGAMILLLFGVRRRHPAFLLTLLATVALLIAFPVVFFWLVEPVNRVFRVAEPFSPPANWLVLRERWEMGHTIRFVLQLVAFSALSASVVAETPEVGVSGRPGA
jgi:hypothetical protein